MIEPTSSIRISRCGNHWNYTLEENGIVLYESAKPINEVLLEDIYNEMNDWYERYRRSQEV